MAEDASSGFLDVVLSRYAPSSLLEMTDPSVLLENDKKRNSDKGFAVSRCRQWAMATQEIASKLKTVYVVG